MSSKKPRRIRSDSRLGHLPEEQRKQVLHWFANCGWESCLVRVRTELGISTNRDSLYTAIKRWETEAQANAWLATARAQVQMESDAAGGMSVEEMEEAVDRHFIVLASQKADTDEYKDLRYMQIAARTARSNARIAQAKLAQGERKLAQKDADLRLAERRVVLLEAKLSEMKSTVEDPTLTDEQRRQRIAEIYGRA
jgi:hypothetical protein